MDESDAVAGVFGSNLKRFREAYGWSQSELARRMQQAGWPKYSQVAVSRTEEGSRTVRLDEAMALARLFKRRVDDLLDAEAVVGSWALLRGLLDRHSDNVVALRDEADEFNRTYAKLKVFTEGLEASIAEEGGPEMVSETMVRTLENAHKLLALTPQEVVEASLEHWSEGQDGVDPEEA